MVERLSAYDAIRKQHDLKVFDRAAVFLPPADMMQFGVNDRKFTHERQIDLWAKKQRTHYRDQISTNPDWGYGKRSLKKIRELVPSLKAALKTQEARKSRYLKQIGYPPIMRDYYKAVEAWCDAELKAVDTVPTTMAGVQALLKFVRLSLEKNEQEPDGADNLESFRAAKAVASVTTALAKFQCDC